MNGQHQARRLLSARRDDSSSLPGSTALASPARAAHLRQRRARMASRGRSILIVDEFGIDTHVAGPSDLGASYRRSVKLRDPAVSVMNDLAEEGAPVVRAECSIAAAMDVCFRLGTRALLVMRDIQVIGVVTVEQLHAGARTDRAATALPTVAELMTQERDLPSIDWQTVLDSTVIDLQEIFQGAQCHYLVVVEKLSESLGRVRGLIHRRAIESRGEF